ncbi:SO2930 family diheme c-type cytochrome [Alteromonadaceae bacterium BrNp21-10]|nr:SO2930 family diheme c-type cytochrome [Alteromonadaceae bacterium BrNp21-10]
MKNCLLLLVIVLLASCSKPFAPVQFVADDNFPENLSDWNVLLLDGDTLRPNQGVVAYDLNMQLFTDHAHKFRTVWMPAGMPANYQPENEFDFPVGTIISKTFYYPKNSNGQLLQTDDYTLDFNQQGLNLDSVHLIETRLLVHQQNGWVALPYVWNKQQNSAILEWAGDAQSLSLIDEQGQSQDFAYIIPDANQCAGCHAPNHTSKAIKPIGLKARHINKPYAFLGGQANQLQHWQGIGYLQGLPQNPPKNASFNDANASIDDLARSYLDINCGHCHNAQGAADTSGLWLTRSETDMRRLGLCKPPVAAGNGAGNGRYSIDPGQGDLSIIHIRMSSLDPGAMMPELGRSTVHQQGASLIKQWINNMPGDCQ